MEYCDVEDPLNRHRLTDETFYPILFQSITMLFANFDNAR
jgi:hypothetical protein